MFLPARSVTGLVMDECWHAKWCEWVLHEVVRAVHMRIGQYFWCDVGLLLEIQLEFRWEKHPAPEVHWT